MYRYVSPGCLSCYFVIKYGCGQQTKVLSRASAVLWPQPKFPAPLKKFTPLVYGDLCTSRVECGRFLWLRFVTPLLGGFTSRWCLAYQEAGSDKTTCIYLDLSLLIHTLNKIAVYIRVVVVVPRVSRYVLAAP